jgi:hypothetical protein
MLALAAEAAAKGFATKPAFAGCRTYVSFVYPSFRSLTLWIIRTFSACTIGPEPISKCPDETAETSDISRLGKNVDTAG